ncbi:MAG: hypothetical protein L0H31_07590 [Nocardioidaceae bacterium]|nr:hypothetical protein [Nocardioidaceae bacterium]
MSATPQLLDCAYYVAAECRSCRWLPRSYADQLAAKQTAAAELVAAPEEIWEEPVASRPDGFRNKAKMVVGGTSAAPSLGILDPTGRGVDLRDCPLHEAPIVAALPVLADFVTRAALAPYQVNSESPVQQRGELKYLLVTASPDAELMVRMVVRSRATEARIRKHLPGLLAALPGLRVVTIQIR